MSRRKGWWQRLAALAASCWLAASGMAAAQGPPDEPYRFVHVPDGWHQAGVPTSARWTARLDSHGRNAAFVANSGELGPQVSVLAKPDWFQASGAKTITVAAVPSAATGLQPADGRIVGNVYTVTARADSGVRVVVNRAAPDMTVVQLRSPTTTEGLVVERQTPTGWQRQATVQVGTNVYQAPLRGFGPFALLLPTSPTTTPGSSNFAAVWVVAIAVFVLAAGVAGVLYRSGRMRRGQ